ncbi:MAG: hypothetical protein H7A55_24260 [Verrucomicrobiaceae bacterium]|nr:hypothetical protein [Verrucomicrobiaceae bacterium]
MKTTVNVCLCFLTFLLVFSARGETRSIRVFVALADNASQGIVPVPPKIGNGDDADENLYWGTSEGFRSVFRNSKAWQKVEAAKPEGGPVLERIGFKHRDQDCKLLAEAWRGSEIKACTEAFFAELKSGEADLVVYVGHDGLMDFSLPIIVGNERKKPAAAMVLCCKSRAFFGPHLEALGAAPVLMTEQLMYPGSFLVRDAAAAWLRGDSLADIRMAAARSYAANQGISVKAAAGVFSTLSE